MPYKGEYYDFFFNKLYMLIDFRNNNFFLQLSLGGPERHKGYPEF